MSRGRFTSLVRPEDRSAFIAMTFLAVASLFTGPIRTISLISYLVGLALASAFVQYDRRSRIRTYRMSDGSVLQLHCPRGRTGLQSDLMAFEFAQSRGITVVHGPWDDEDE